MSQTPVAAVRATEAAKSPGDRARVNEVALERRAFLVWELGEATVRLAISVGPEEGRSLVETFKRLTSREIANPSLPGKS